MHNQKELLKGTLTAIILKLIDENGKMYGYEISQKVKGLSDGKIMLKDGSLYPALQKLTHEGLLSVEEVKMGKRVRKYYYLTPQGKSLKDAYFAELKEFIETMSKLFAPQLSTQP